MRSDGTDLLEHPLSGEDSLEGLPLERLEAEIVTLAGQIAAATAVLLGAIAAYDRRRGWEQWGCASMAQWLAWKCGMGASTAREHIRVGHALADLPALRAELAAGRLSYSQVRAVTRVAVPATEEYWVDLARYSTGGQLDRLIAAYRGVKAATIETARERYARRGVRSFVDEHGMRVVVAVLAPEDGEAVVKGLQVRASALTRALPGEDARALEPDQAMADALVEAVGSCGAAGASEAVTPVVMVHTTMAVLDGTDPDGPCHLDGGVPLAAETARRLACDCPIQEATDTLGFVLDIGRRSRKAPAALRRALAVRDGRCAYPGCDAAGRGHTHHVTYWTDDGPTSLDNLVMLCRFHHYRVHEGGYQVAWGDRRPGGVGGWVFTRPDGRTVPSVAPGGPSAPWLPDSITGPIDPAASESDWDGGRLDASMAIEALLVTEGLLDTPNPDPGGLAEADGIGGYWPDPYGLADVDVDRALREPGGWG